MKNISKELAQVYVSLYCPPNPSPPHNFLLKYFSRANMFESFHGYKAMHYIIIKQSSKKDSQLLRILHTDLYIRYRWIQKQDKELQIQHFLYVCDRN